MKRNITKRRRNQPERRLRLPGAKDMLTAREVAQESGIGLLSVYALLRSGDLPARKVGSRYYVARAAYVRWLQRWGDSAA